MSDTADSETIELTYYQYETVKETYIVQRGADKGKEKESTRTERRTHTETIKDIVTNLENTKKVYLLHRYLVVQNAYHWKIVLLDQSSKKPIFHMDFSENVALTAKKEAKDAHFLKKQYSLHCTVQR